jgi:hypothetical protein
LVLLAYFNVLKNGCRIEALQLGPLIASSER